MEDKRFGIEVEFTGVTRGEVADAFEKFFRRKADADLINLSDGTSYFKYKIADNDGFIWTIQRDRSVRAEVLNDAWANIDISCSSDSDLYMCELVSPVLTSSSLDTLLSLIDIIKALGGVVNNSCGIHIHVDAPKKKEDLITIFKKFVSMQEFIVKDFNIEACRLEKYCKLYEQCFVDYILDETDSLDMHTFTNKFCHYFDTEHSVALRHHKSRYHALNFHSLLKHNTLEFRFFNSTLDKKEIIRILDWILHFMYTPEECGEQLSRLNISY